MTMYGEILMGEVIRNNQTPMTETSNLYII